MVLATKIWSLWPSVLPIFFASMKIYVALNSILNQIIS
jgi:hypothetical protein